MRPFALACAFLLSLSLTASARADEKEFQKAAAEWRALFQPLKTARMVDAGPFLDRISREGKEKNDAIRHQCDWAKSYLVLLKVQQEGWETLEELFARSNPRERRALLRRFAILGDVYEDSDVPRYPTCGTGLEAEFNHNARELFVAAVKKEPAAYLGLLDDADPRVAELTANCCQHTHPDEVRTRIMRWMWSPQARFRGIAAIWVSHHDVYWPFFERDEASSIVYALLDDPVEAIRREVLKRLPESERDTAYSARASTFEKAPPGKKWTTLWLGLALNRPEILPMAQASLTSEESVIRMSLDVMQAKEIPVPKETLLRLMRHPTPKVRCEAYLLAGGRLSYSEVRPGLDDRDKEVARWAFSAACEGVVAREELAFLIRRARTAEERYDLPKAARKLGDLALPEILALLAHPDEEKRLLGIEMGVGAWSARMREPIYRMAQDPSWKIRRYLVGHIHLPKADFQPLLELLMKDSDSGIRASAEKRLQSLGKE